jgi:nicotinamide-nucleotide amidase
MFNDEALKNIRDYLLTANETIAVAESVTSGFLQAAFSTAPDAAKIFQGGITAYNLGQKYKHLQVEPIHAEACNCVSDEVASDMALYVCTAFKSHWGLALTGYATKVKEGDNDLFAHYAISYLGHIVNANIFYAKTREGIDTQLYFVNELLEVFYNSIIKRTNQVKVKNKS